MMALSVAYQAERPNVETSDMTALVIRALGMVVGQSVKEDGDNGDVGDVGDTVELTRLFVSPTPLRGW